MNSITCQVFNHLSFKCCNMNESYLPLRPAWTWAGRIYTLSLPEYASCSHQSVHLLWDQSVGEEKCDKANIFIDTHFFSFFEFLTPLDKWWSVQRNRKKKSINQTRFESVGWDKGVTSLTNIFVVNRHKNINRSLDSQQSQTEEDQQLENDVAPGPHVGDKQVDLLPETLPRGLILLCSSQQTLHHSKTEAMFEKLACSSRLS